MSEADPFTLLLIINECESEVDRVTKESFKDSINSLIQKFIEENDLPDLKIPLERYKGDDVRDLQNALRKICTGENIMNNIENMLNKFQMVLNEK